MIITRRVAGRPTGMPARPYRTVRYGRALSPVLSVLAYPLARFHRRGLPLVPVPGRQRRSTPCGTPLLYSYSPWTVRVLAASSTGKYRGRTRAATSVSRCRRLLARVNVAINAARPSSSREPSPLAVTRTPSSANKRPPL